MMTNDREQKIKDEQYWQDRWKDWEDIPRRVAEQGQRDRNFVDAMRDQSDNMPHDSFASTSDMSHEDIVKEMLREHKGIFDLIKGCRALDHRLRRKWLEDLLEANLFEDIGEDDLMYLKADVKVYMERDAPTSLRLQLEHMHYALWDLAETCKTYQAKFGR